MRIIKWPLNTPCLSHNYEHKMLVLFNKEVHYQCSMSRFVYMCLGMRPWLNCNLSAKACSAKNNESVRILGDTNVAWENG